MTHVNEHLLVEVADTDLVVRDENSGAQITIPHDAICDFGAVVAHLQWELFIAPKTPAEIRNFGRKMEAARRAEMRREIERELGVRP